MNEYSQKGSIWTWVAVIAGIVIIGSLVYLLFFSNSSSAVAKPVKEELQLLKENKFKDAYNNTSANFKKYTTEQQFYQALNTYPTLKTYKKYSIDDSQISQSKGCAKTVIANSNNTAIIVYFGLSKESNVWKISALTINPKTQVSCKTLLGIK